MAEPAEFSDLPPEMRRNIWQASIEDGRDIVLRIKQFFRPSDDQLIHYYFVPDSRTEEPTPLWAVSKEAYGEFFSKYKLEFKSPEDVQNDSCTGILIDFASDTVCMDGLNLRQNCQTVYHWHDELGDVRTDNPIVFQTCKQSLELVQHLSLSDTDVEYSNLYRPSRDSTPWDLLSSFPNLVSLVIVKKQEREEECQNSSARWHKTQGDKFLERVREAEKVSEAARNQRWLRIALTCKFPQVDVDGTGGSGAGEKTRADCQSWTISKMDKEPDQDTNLKSILYTETTAKFDKHYTIFEQRRRK